MRAACRSVLEGRLRALLPDMKRLHAELKPKVLETFDRIRYF